MKTQILTTLLALVVFVVPAAVPASQPANIKLTDLAAAPVTIAPATSNFALLLNNPADGTDLSIELVTGYTTLEWINQDPFVL